MAFHIMEKEYGVTRLLDPEGNLFDPSVPTKVSRCHPLGLCCKRSGIVTWLLVLTRTIADFQKVNIELVLLPSLFGIASKALMSTGYIG